MLLLVLSEIRLLRISACRGCTVYNPFPIWQLFRVWKQRLSLLHFHFSKLHMSDLFLSFFSKHTFQNWISPLRTAFQNYVPAAELTHQTFCTQTILPYHDCSGSRFALRSAACLFQSGLHQKLSVGSSAFMGQPLGPWVSLLSAIYCCYLQQERDNSGFQNGHATLGFIYICNSSELNL